MLPSPFFPWPLVVDGAAGRSLLIFSLFINFHFYRGESNFILTAAEVLMMRVERHLVE